jgi:hypothetical protein
MKAWPWEVVQEAFRLRDEGVPKKLISRKLGPSTHTLNDWFNRPGYLEKINGRRKSNPSISLDGNDARATRQIESLYRSTGTEAVVVAEQLIDAVNETMEYR